MCERCLLEAEINKKNAAALLDLANAATALAINVPGSGTAVSDIVERIEKMSKLPRESKVSGEAGPNPETSKPVKGELPAELQGLKNLFESLGMDVEFIDASALDKKLH